MVPWIKNFVVLGLEIVTALFLFFAIFIPLSINARKIIRDKNLESSDTATKISFLFFFLAIISATLLFAVQYAANIVEVIYIGVGLAVVLLFFVGLTLFQLRISRGKGALKKFFETRHSEKKRKKRR